MFKYGNIKSFITKTILGLFFLFIAIFLFISLISLSSSDIGFGKTSNSYIILNNGGLFGAYIASSLIVFFDLSSYLIVLYFFSLGCRFCLGFQNRLILFKFLILFLGLCFLNFSQKLIRMDSGVIGQFVVDLFGKYLNGYLENIFLVGIFFILSLLVSLLLIYYSLQIYLIKYTNKIKVFSNLLKLLYLPFVYLFLTIVMLIKKIMFREKSHSVSRIIKKNKVRSEPTIKKNNRAFNKDTTKIYAGSRSLKYSLPPKELLSVSNKKSKNLKEIERRNVEFSKQLEKILSEYGVEGKVVNFKYGPVVTLYEFLPAAGIKTSKVVGLSDDIARAMSSLSTRISSQPGKTSIGIEIPNLTREGVLLGDLICDADFSSSEGLTLALGKNISGDKRYTDLEKMPHLLIAGTTGSGKSVGINSMIISLLYRFTPSECKLILIDPKMLELSIYENIPHLLTPVVTDPNKAVFALKWVVREMENRYRLMSSLNVKNIKSFNKRIVSSIDSGRKLYREVQTGIDNETRMPIIEKKEIPLEKMPLIVVVIDEMADLMMVAGKEVENLVQRLAQMARASGIHLIAATQRPSVDVITGTIKANFPSRISFRVASRFDSRTILNEMGAEQLLGSGDMLFLENGSNLIRVHGGYISESEIEEIVKFIKSQSNKEVQKDITLETNDKENNMRLDFENKGGDELYEKAVNLIIDQQKVSTSFIQRYLQIGYNRAARMVEKMEEEGYISEPTNAGKRSVLKKNK